MTDTGGITTLDTHRCLELLRTAEVGRLAVSISDHPDIFPINYVVDHGTVVFRSADGTKLAGVLLGRGVAFEVDGYDAGAGEAWSVVIKGYAVEIEQMHQYFDALDLPLFPWHVVPSTGSFESNRSRSPDANSALSAPRRGGASAQACLGLPRNERRLTHTAVRPNCSNWTSRRARH